MITQADQLAGVLLLGSVLTVPSVLDGRLLVDAMDFGVRLPWRGFE